MTTKEQAQEILKVAERFSQPWIWGESKTGVAMALCQQVPELARSYIALQSRVEALEGAITGSVLIWILALLVSSVPLRALVKSETGIDSHASSSWGYSHLASVHSNQEGAELLGMPFSERFIVDTPKKENRWSSLRSYPIYEISRSRRFIEDYERQGDSRLKAAIVILFFESHRSIGKQRPMFRLAAGFYGRSGMSNVFDFDHNADEFPRLQCFLKPDSFDCHTPTHGLLIQAVSALGGFGEPLRGVSLVFHPTCKFFRAIGLLTSSNGYGFGISPARFHFGQLASHGAPLKNANYDDSGSQENDITSKPDHPFLGSANAIFKAVYLGCHFLLGYGLCVRGVWVIWRRWRVNRLTGWNLLHGLLLYAFAGIIVWHGLTVTQ